LTHIETENSHEVITPSIQVKTIPSLSPSNEYAVSGKSSFQIAKLAPYT
jgi:hypothetical protein